MDITWENHCIYSEQACVSLTQIYIFTNNKLKNPNSSWCNKCYLLSLTVSPVKLLGFGLALNYRIHSLQVGWVCHERQSDVLVRFAVDPLVEHPKVVFDIP